MLFYGVNRHGQNTFVTITYTINWRITNIKYALLGDGFRLLTFQKAVNNDKQS